MSISNYRDLWEELEELLREMNVPKPLWHQSEKLNNFLCFNMCTHTKVHRAVKILHEISPVPLIQHNIMENRNAISKTISQTL